jgi:hypothetical protein
MSDCRGPALGAVGLPDVVARAPSGLLHCGNEQLGALMLTMWKDMLQVDETEHRLRIGL